MVSALNLLVLLILTLNSALGQTDVIVTKSESSLGVVRMSTYEDMALDKIDDEFGLCKKKHGHDYSLQTDGYAPYRNNLRFVCISKYLTVPDLTKKLMILRKKRRKAFKEGNNLLADQYSKDFDRSLNLNCKDGFTARYVKKSTIKCFSNNFSLEQVCSSRGSRVAGQRCYLSSKDSGKANIWDGLDDRFKN